MIQKPARIASLYFIQFFAWGTVAPVLSLFLKQDAGFTGAQAGLILSSSAAAVFISPVISSVIADRFITSRKMLIICNLAAALLLFFLIREREFIPFLVLFLLYMLINQPLSGLINAVTFHNLKDSNKDFGRMRVWGTIGWAAAGWTFGLIGLFIPDASLKIIMNIGIFVFILQALYSLFLPESETLKKPLNILPADIFRDFFQKNVVITVMISLAVFITDTFYYFGISIHLRESGLSESQIMPVMSIGQITEIAAMYMLGYLLSKWTYKKVLQLGILMEIFRFALLAVSDNIFIIGAGILFHGPAYTFFFATAFIYLDKQLTSETRSGVHQLFVFSINGFGKLLGNWLAGFTLDHAQITGGKIDFSIFWIIPLVINLLIFIPSLFIKRIKKKV